MKRTYKVNGMTCASCVRSVETMLNAQKGVNKALVNLAEKSVMVDFDNSLIFYYKPIEDFASFERATLSVLIYVINPASYSF